MIRFGLASVVAVSGCVLVLGSCVGSDPSTSVVEDAGSPPSGDAGSNADSGGIDGTPKEAGVDAPVDADAGPMCPKAATVTTADLDKDYGWKPATKTVGACSAADVATLETNLKNMGTTNYLALGNGVSAACVACAITSDAATSWGPIVTHKATNGATGFFNFGACFGAVESTTCGKSLQYEQYCYEIVCGECPTSAERQKCLLGAGEPGGACKSFADTTRADCPNLQETAKQCNNVIDAVRTLCGS